MSELHLSEDSKKRTASGWHPGSGYVIFRETRNLLRMGLHTEFMLTNTIHILYVYYAHSSYDHRSLIS